MKRFLILFLILSCLLIASCDMIDTSMFQGKAEYFTVEFDSEGGSTVEPIQAQKNYIVKRPHNPTRDGYFLMAGTPRTVTNGILWTIPLQII